VFITDFGLARIESDATLTMTGDLLGTLRYMSPEQAEGRSAILDHRTDIYSLGITLYELLTLRPAFPTTDRQTLLRQIAGDEPPAPRKLNPAIPADLETILLKAIAKEPRDRYASAAAVVGDLRRFLSSKPILARPPNLLSRLRKSSRRHRTAVTTALATLILCLVVGTVLIGQAYRSERKQREQAVTAQAKSAAAQARAESSLALARQAVDDMYTNVATVWLTQDTAFTAIQRELLRRALGVYQTLAQEPAIDDASLRSVAEAHSRIGEIHRLLGNDRAAVAAIEMAIALDGGLADQAHDSDEHLLMLALRYRTLATIQMETAQWDQADRSLAAGASCVQALLGRSPTHLDYKLLSVLYRLMSVEQARASGRFADGESLAKNLQKDTVALDQKYPADQHDIVVAGLKAGVLLVDLIARQNRFAEAQKLAASTLYGIQYSRRMNFHDSRELAQLEAEALHISADIAVRQGDPQSAALHLKEALVLKESQLRAKRRPSVYLTEASFRNDAGLKLLENFELAAFRSYAETQLRLAYVMHSLGKPYEAERLLGECVNTAYMLSEAAGDKSLDNMALFGGTWTAVEELIAMDRPEEVEQARNAADHIWQITAARFPGAVRHPDLSPQAIERLTWHSQNGARRLSAELWKSYQRAILPKIAFIDRARALRWFHREDWNTATVFFKKSAEARKSDQAYDWLYTAMAQHHQGNPDEARTWFDRAAAALADDAPQELIELRVEAERLLAGSSKTSTTGEQKPANTAPQ
jgi:hypothetical protein